MKNQRKERKKRFKIKLLLLAAVLLGLVLLADARLRPVIRTMAAYQAKIYATQAINDSVYQELSQLNLRYDNLVNLTYNDEGNISSLQTDMIAMGRLQSSITNRVIDRILLFDDQTIKIPLGTLLGGQLLSGRGPKVEIKLIPSSFIETSITNLFDSAGINQTRHQIMLNTRLTVSAVIPGYSVTTTVSAKTCLAETVIIGLVPGAYTEVYDGTDPLIGMIQDYGAAE